MIIAILDANVLYPAPLRDYLLHLAAVRLYRPAWSAEIQEEWIGNLLINRADLKRGDLEKTRKAMDAAFPAANIRALEYKKFIATITLPDQDDRHVLAAAIAAKANVIVTNNLKDFPSKELDGYGVQALHPDDFVLQLIQADRQAALAALHNQVALLRNPPLLKADVLRNLETCGLAKSVAALM